MPAPIMLCFALILLATLLQIRSERRTWNGGVCRETGQPWRHFDTSSQGCRGYKSGGHYIWISWPVDGEQSKETGDE